jgi:hypothetical protein
MSHRLLLGMLLVALAGGRSLAQPPAEGVVSPAAAGATPAPTPIVAAPEDPLLTQIDQAIQVNGQRFLTANYHSPWQIFHGILAYRQDFQLKLGEQKISAIEWVATNEPRFDGLPLLLVTVHGAKFHPFTREYAFEGHPSQTLALLSESHLPVDYAFKVGERKVTIADFLNNTMMEVGVNPQDEITWVLWALNNYLKPDAQWRNQMGQPWSIERLVQHQVSAAVVGGPCGGNHGLFAIAKARDKYVSHGGQLRGVWLQADQKINQYIEYARLLQNPDGSFSSNFYAGRGYSQDMNTRFNTTGHTLEFLSVGLPDARLNDQWVRNAAQVLSKELIDNRRAQASPGPLYHSVNALRNYGDRLRKTTQKSAAIAATPATPAPTATVPATPAPSTPPVASSEPVTATPAAPTPAPITVSPAPATSTPSTTATPAPATTVAPAPATPTLTIPAPAAPNPTVLPAPPAISTPAPPAPTTTTTPPVPDPNTVALPPLVVPRDVAIPTPTPIESPGIAKMRPMPRVTPPMLGTSRSTPPAPLVIAPDEAIPAPLPEINPVAKSVLPQLFDPSRIQPGLLAAEAPVSALTPVNR